MIPLRDTNPSRTVPFVTYAILVANVIVFLFEFSLGEKEFAKFIFKYGVIPSHFTDASGSIHFSPSGIVTLFSSMFLHGGWFHLIGNMLFLHVFGDNVEDRFGHLKYLVFYLLAGIAAALAQSFMNPASTLPMVGASGAIAGVLGAYVLMFPTAKVATLIPIFIFFQIIELPAFIFLGIWFLMQMLSGMLSLGIAADAGGVAWWAHIGGFATGLVMVPILKKPNWR